MIKNYIILWFFTLLLADCGNSYLRESTNVSNIKKKYDKILVVARTKDKIARIRAEGLVVNELGLRGVKAESSVDVIKTENFSEEMSDEEIETLISQLLDAGFSGVLITNVINREQYKDVIRGGSNLEYQAPQYGRFGQYYNYYPATSWEPDQIETGVDYTVESCLYDITVAQKDNLQWVGRFKLKNPTDIKEAIAQYSKELADALIDQSINP
ncbi:hypothetical protein [uncultured Eudoraea sp.]|uniref:hypothetical protein n=1 Tax=uncultured Eudoraea sp. TaxID=1035614 RepID=UPI00260F52D2|nr:hypothetical protein [uncultured Eudoraea sp.]